MPEKDRTLANAGIDTFGIYIDPGKLDRLEGAQGAKLDPFGGAAIVKEGRASLIDGSVEIVDIVVLPPFRGDNKEGR